MLLGNINSGSTAGQILTRPATIRRIDKYPIRRGLSGLLLYYFGMTVTRLSIRLHAEGLENIPGVLPYVIAANHETYVDGMWIGSYLPKRHFRSLSCIAAKELEDRHGLIGRMIVKVGRAISIDRFGNPARGLILARKAVDEGNIMLVHPEGTRTRDGHLGEMKDGAAFIAMKSKVPLLPVFLDGGFEVFNRYMKTPQSWNPVTRQKREVILTFGKPLQPTDFESAKEMTLALEAWMHRRFKEKKVPRIYLPSMSF
jgi:1-acyl-sn-glycerol-3-phosphate acyltransferase